MSNFTVLVKKDLLEQWRTKKLLVLAITMLFVAVGSPIIAKITPEILKSVQVPGLTVALPTPTYVDALDQFIKNLSQIALLVLIFLVAGTVVDEKNRKTLEIVLTKPVSRSTFILSKFAGSLLSLTVVYAAAVAIFYGYTVSLLGGFSLVNFCIMAAATLLYLWLIVSVTILASTFSRNLMAAAGLGFGGYIVFGVFFSLFSALKPYSPDWIFGHYRSLVAAGWTNDLIWPLVVAGLFVVAVVVAAVAIFKRQEIER